MVIVSTREVSEMWSKYVLPALICIVFPVIIPVMVCAVLVISISNAMKKEYKEEE